MQKFVDTFKKLSTKKRFLVVLCGVVVVVAVVLINSGTIPTTPAIPPVTVVTPEITLVSIDPSAGSRQSVDTRTFTAFEFSAPVNADAVVVQISPYIALKKSVFSDRSNILYVEPQSTAWVSGTNYTIIIKKGFVGLNGEELKQDVIYTFSNTPPDAIYLDGPI